ncbi:hypothetical protein BHE74_00058354 [Ensete ventricosum]|nr:hypothetical protein BHE74_00058354 [Ensete ventricosum]
MSMRHSLLPPAVVVLPQLPHASRCHLCCQPSSLPLPQPQLLLAVTAHPCDLAALAAYRSSRCPLLLNHSRSHTLLSRCSTRAQPPSFPPAPAAGQHRLSHCLPCSHPQPPLGATHTNATTSFLSHNHSPRRTATALTFLPRFLVRPRCCSPRRTPSASFSSLCLYRSSRPPLPSLLVDCCLLPLAPIVDAAVVLLLRLLPTAYRRYQLSATTAVLSSNLLYFLRLFHPLLPLS